MLITYAICHRNILYLTSLNSASTLENKASIVEGIYISHFFKIKMFLGQLVVLFLEFLLLRQGKKTRAKISNC